MSGKSGGRGGDQVTGLNPGNGVVPGDGASPRVKTDRLGAGNLMKEGAARWGWVGLRLA